jgi:hypothetical protein
MERVNVMSCAKQPCAKEIPKGLVDERLCLDHFLEVAFQRTEGALEKVHNGQKIDPKGLETLLADALAVVNNLDDEPPVQEAGQRDRMLELLLLLANVHEYVAHQNIRPVHLA